VTGPAEKPRFDGKKTISLPPDLAREAEELARSRALDRSAASPGESTPSYRGALWSCGTTTLVVASAELPDSSLAL